MCVWVCDLWGLWVGLVVEGEGGWVLVVAIGMVCCGLLGFSCGNWDGGLWVAGFWLWQLGWSIVVVCCGFLGFMKACSSDGD